MWARKPASRRTSAVFSVSLRGTYDRVWYRTAINSDGTTLNLAATSYNDFGALLRASYEATPDLKPFVEGDVDSRVHDQPIDFNGFYRDSDGYTVRGGAQVNVSELAERRSRAGYGERNYGPAPAAAARPGDRRRADLHALAPDHRDAARLDRQNETTLAYASGVLTRSITRNPLA